MINTNKVRGRITELGLTIQIIAPQIGVTPYTLGKKIANESPMTLDEALKLSIILKIPERENFEYFFYNLSCKTQQKLAWWGGESMKIECTVEELKEMLKEKTSDAGTSNAKEIMKEALNQVLRQDLLIQIDTKAPSLIELKESLKKK